LKNISNSEKINVLLAALNERYKATHEIRNRVFNTCTWLMGILIGIAGWLVQAKINLNTNQKIFLLVILFVVFIIIRFFYLGDLEKGFKNQFRVACHIEDALGLYKKGYYTDSKNSIFPTKWKETGKNKCDGKYFQSSYFLLYFAILALSTTIIFITKLSN